MRKGILFVLSLLVISIVFAQKPTLFRATYQEWSGGARGSGSGINYRIWFTCKDAEKVTFDKAWIEEDFFTISPINVRISTSQPDTIKITINRVTRRGDENQNRTINGVKKEETDSSFKPEKTPFKLKGKGRGIVSYTIGKKRKYIEIRSFQEIPSLPIP